MPRRLIANGKEQSLEELYESVRPDLEQATCVSLNRPLSEALNQSEGRCRCLIYSCCRPRSDSKFVPPCSPGVDGGRAARGVWGGVRGRGLSEPHSGRITEITRHGSEEGRERSVQPGERGGVLFPISSSPLVLDVSLQ